MSLFTSEVYEEHIGRISVFSVQCGNITFTIERFFQTEVCQRKMPSGKITTQEQNLSAVASYADPRWQKQEDHTGSLPHTVCYSWWKNTFLALASKSHSSKSELMCGQRVLAAGLACFGKWGERKHGCWKPVRAISEPKKAEKGWMTWEQFCFTATSGSALAKYKYGSPTSVFNSC